MAIQAGAIVAILKATYLAHIHRTETPAPRREAKSARVSLTPVGPDKNQTGPGQTAQHAKWHERRIVGVDPAEGGGPSPAPVWGWTRRSPRRRSCGPDSRRSPAGEAPCPAASVCSAALQTRGRTTEPPPSSASRSLKHSDGEKRLSAESLRSSPAENRLRLTVSEQPDDSGHIWVVFIVSLDEDVLAGVDDGGPRETLHTDG